MRIHLKRFALLLTVCMLLVPLCLSGLRVSAANMPNLDAPGGYSLTVKVNDESYAEHADSFVVDVYHLANFNEYLQLALVGNAFDDLVQAYKDGKYDAKTFAKEALKRSVGVAPTDTMGMYEGKSLEAALYLVVVHGADDCQYLYDEKDEICGTTVDVGAFRYRFEPWVISLPSYDEVNDVWYYDAELSFKAQRDLMVNKTLNLHKVDAADGVTPLPGAKFKLYSTRIPSDTLPSDTITAYVEGQGYVTLYCVGEEVVGEDGEVTIVYEHMTDANGNLSVKAPVLDDNTLYAWVETKAPYGYELDSTPHFFFAYGDEPHYVGGIVYENWINQSDVLATRLRYNSANPNDTGDVTVKRELCSTDYGTGLKLTFTNEGKESVYLRVKAFTDNEYSPLKKDWEDEALLGRFVAKGVGDEWMSYEDNWFVYALRGDLLFLPGETTEFTYLVEDGMDGYPSALDAYLGRLAIVYDAIPESAGWDWTWDPQTGEGGHYAPAVQPEWGVKSTGGAYKAEKSVSGANGGSTTAVQIENAATPPDEPGEELPSTGGSGTVAFYIAGGGLIAIALFLYMVRKRERDEA